MQKNKSCLRLTLIGGGVIAVIWVLGMVISFVWTSLNSPEGFDISLLFIQSMLTIIGLFSILAITAILGFATFWFSRQQKVNLDWSDVIEAPSEITSMILLSR